MPNRSFDSFLVYHFLLIAELWHMPIVDLWHDDRRTCGFFLAAGSGKDKFENVGVWVSKPEGAAENLLAPRTKKRRRNTKKTFVGCVGPKRVEML